jgi:hypothetical protein|tara:strand:- start:555 stop:1019 length:465 start_codon:yes stop_codon:yes gene_type:complete
MIYNCENNFISNLDNRELSIILQKNLPWFLSENKNLLYHVLVFNNEPISTFYSLLEPFQKKVNKEINEATFFMLLPNSEHKKIIDDSNNKYEESKFMKLIYHVDSSDGYTEIFAKDKINYTQNSSILIDNQLNTAEFNPIKSNFSLILKVLFNK